MDTDDHRWTRMGGPLPASRRYSAEHHLLVDDGNHLTVLVHHGGAEDDEDHRAAAAGLFVDVVHRARTGQDVADADRRSHLDVLAGVEAVAAEAAQVARHEVRAAQRDGEGPRRNEPTVGSARGSSGIGVQGIGLAVRVRVGEDLRLGYRRENGMVELLSDHAAVDRDLRHAAPRAARTCSRKSTGRYPPWRRAATRSSMVRISWSNSVAQIPIKLTRWASLP